MGVRDTKESLAAYMHVYRRNRYKRIMQKIIEHLGGKCVQCGNTGKLDIDHKDKKTKKFNISTGIEVVSLKILWKEVKKCQILCKDCHRIKSAKECLSAHGTKARYVSKSFPCRCSLCRIAYNKWHKKDRKRRKDLGLKVW